MARCEVARRHARARSTLARAPYVPGGHPAAGISRTKRAYAHALRGRRVQSEVGRSRVHRTPIWGHIGDILQSPQLPQNLESVTVQSLGSDERGGWIAAVVGGDQFGEELEQGAALLAAGDGG
jgi:hypothetical protein